MSREPFSLAIIADDEGYLIYRDQSAGPAWLAVILMRFPYIVQSPRGGRVPAMTRQGARRVIRMWKQEAGS